MVRERAAGQADGVGGDAEVAADEGEVAGFDGDVGAGAHGEAEVGLGEGGGVVDAVADHGDDLALGLEAADDVDLVGGEDLGDDLVDADLVGDGSGGPLVVAGEQDRVAARAPRSSRDGLGQVGLTVSATTSTARAAPSQPTRIGGAADGLGGVLGGSRGRRGGGMRPVGEEPLAAGDDGVAVDDALHAEALAVREAPRPGASSTPRSRAPAAMAWAMGCSEASSSGTGEAQHLVGGRCRRR